MKILLIGQLPDLSVGRAYVDAFRKLCCEVEELDYFAGMNSMHALVLAGRLGQLAGDMARDRLTRRVLQRVRSADTVFAIKGIFLQPWFWPEVRRITGAAIVNFHPDDPFNFNGSSSAAHVAESIRHFDVYFIWSKKLIPALNRAGARRAEYLPFGADLKNFYPVELTAEDFHQYESNICFVGNWDPERERWLQSVADLGLSIWGADWSRSRRRSIRRAWRGRQVIGDELRRVMASSKIQLNILRVQNKGGHNMRTFEVPACGAFGLFEASADLPGLFAEGVEVESFRTVDELRSKARRYLVDTADRCRIAKCGYERALGQSYDVRAFRVLDILHETRQKQVQGTVT